MSTVNVPQIFDTGKRVARTAIQASTAVFTGFVTLAAVYQIIEPVVGAPSSSNFIPWLIGAALAVGSNAALIARIMAIPSVNACLTAIGLGGHSGSFTAADTHTTFVQTIPAAAVDAH